jgi:hypothetical protein
MRTAGLVFGLRNVSAAHRASRDPGRMCPGLPARVGADAFVRAPRSEAARDALTIL